METNPGEQRKPGGRIEIAVDDNVTLKQMIAEDAEPFFNVIDRNRDHLSQFGDETANKYPDLESYQLRMATQEPGEYRFGIWDQAEPVGFIKVTERAEGLAEIGYWLGSEYTGKGYMSESADALSRYAKVELGFGELIAKVVKGNSNSLKVLRGVGYDVVGENPDDTSEWLLKYNPDKDVLVSEGELASRGVYANRDLAKDEIVVPYHLQPLTTEEFDALPDSEKEFTHAQHGQIHLYSEPERYVNHSDDPNTYQDFELQADVALRAIAKGEMITTDDTKDDVE